MLSYPFFIFVLNYDEIELDLLLFNELSRFNLFFKFLRIKPKYNQYLMDLEGRQED